jgi:hypothetical protein
MRCAASQHTEVGEVHAVVSHRVLNELSTKPPVAVPSVWPNASPDIVMLVPPELAAFMRATEVTCACQPVYAEGAC